VSQSHCAPSVKFLRTMGSLRAHSRSVQDRISLHPASWMLPPCHTNERLWGVLRSNPPPHMGTRAGEGHRIQEVDVSRGSDREKDLHKLRSLIPTSIRALNTLTLTYSHAHYKHLLICTHLRTFYTYSLIHPHAHSPHLLLPVHARSTYPHSHNLYVIILYTRIAHAHLVNTRHNHAYTLTHTLHTLNH
jgi:hypothetical protein